MCVISGKKKKKKHKKKSSKHKKHKKKRLVDLGRYKAQWPIHM